MNSIFLTVILSFNLFTMAKIGKDIERLTEKEIKSRIEKNIYMLTDVKNGYYDVLFDKKSDVNLNYVNSKNESVLTILAVENQLDIIEKLEKERDIFNFKNEKFIVNRFIIVREKDLNKKDLKYTPIYKESKIDYEISKLLSIFTYFGNEKGIDYVLSLKKDYENHPNSFLYAGDVDFFFAFLNEYYFMRDFKYQLTPIVYAFCSRNEKLIDFMLEKKKSLKNVGICLGMQHNFDLLKKYSNNEEINLLQAIYSAIVFDNLDAIKYIIENHLEKLDFSNYKDIAGFGVMKYAIGFKRYSIFDYLVEKKIYLKYSEYDYFNLKEFSFLSELWYPLILLQLLPEELQEVNHDFELYFKLTTPTYFEFFKYVVDKYPLFREKILEQFSDGDKNSLKNNKFYEYLKIYIEKK